MFHGQRVPGEGEVVVLVDQPHVQARRAGLAVVAVDAGPVHVARGEGADGGVVPRLGGGAHKAEHPLQVRPAAHPGQHGEHARLVQRVLDALVLGERLAEGGGLVVEQLAAGKRLHHRDADPLRLAAAVELHPLGGAAVGELPVLVVIGGVDAEHQHVHQAGVQHLPGGGRRVRGQADAAHDALFLQAEQVIQHAVFPVLLPVGRLIQAVDEAVVNVVSAQRLELPGDRALRRLAVGGPAVALAVAVAGAEVNLIAHPVARAGKGLTKGGEVVRLGGGQVVVVHAALKRHAQQGDALPAPCLADGAAAQADHADLVAGAAVDAVFHR